MRGLGEDGLARDPRGDRAVCGGRAAGQLEREGRRGREEGGGLSCSCAGGGRVHGGRAIKAGWGEKKGAV